MMRNSVILSCVLIVSCLFAFVTPTAQAAIPSEFVNFDSLNAGDEIYANTALAHEAGGAPATGAGSLRAGNTNTDLSGSYLAGPSSGGQDQVIKWNFTKPETGTEVGIISWTHDFSDDTKSYAQAWYLHDGGAGTSFTIGHTTVSNLGYGGASSGWSGTMFNATDPVTMSATVTWVEGNASTTDIPFSITQGATVWTTTITPAANVSQLRILHSAGTHDNTDYDNFSFVDVNYVVPEPGALGLLLMGLAVLGWNRVWRRRRHS